MFEVGRTYTAANGVDFECIAVGCGYGWLKQSPTSPAYVWLMDGTSLSLGPSHTITFDPRDQEIADLKTRIAVLTSMLYQ